MSLVTADKIEVRETEGMSPEGCPLEELQEVL